MIMHAPIEGSADSEAWWSESQRVATLLPSVGVTVFFVDANGRVGSSESMSVGSVNAELQTMSGFFSPMDVGSWSRHLQYF